MVEASHFLGAGVDILGFCFAPLSVVRHLAQENIWAKEAPERKRDVMAIDSSVIQYPFRSDSGILERRCVGFRASQPGKPHTD